RSTGCRARCSTWTRYQDNDSAGGSDVKPLITHRIGVRPPNRCLRGGIGVFEGNQCLPRPPSSVLVTVPSVPSTPSRSPPRPPSPPAPGPLPPPPPCEGGWEGGWEGVVVGGAGVLIGALLGGGLGCPP